MPSVYLYNYININQESSYVVVATIRMVEEEFGWFYKAHRKCHKKVFTKTEYLEQAKVIPDNFIEAPIDSLWCVKCACMADSLVPKYKFYLYVISFHQQPLYLYS